jgi:uncharacterized membrane protein
MVLGYFIATGIETSVELGFWLVRKTASGIYYMIYGDEESEKEDELKELRREISELKDLIKKN